MPYLPGPEAVFSKRKDSRVAVGLKCLELLHFWTAFFSKRLFTHYLKTFHKKIQRLQEKNGCIFSDRFLPKTFLQQICKISTNFLYTVILTKAISLTSPKILTRIYYFDVGFYMKSKRFFYFDVRLSIKSAQTPKIKCKLYDFFWFALLMISENLDKILYLNVSLSSKARNPQNEMQALRIF